MAERGSQGKKKLPQIKEEPDETFEVAQSSKRTSIATTGQEVVNVAPDAGRGSIVKDNPENQENGELPLPEPRVQPEPGQRKGGRRSVFNLLLTHTEGENEKSETVEQAKRLVQEELDPSSQLEHFDVQSLVEPDFIKTVALRPPKKKRVKTGKSADKLPGPVASKVVFLTSPEVFAKQTQAAEEPLGEVDGEGQEDATPLEKPHIPEPEPADYEHGSIMLLFEDHLPEDTDEDKLIDLKLTQLIDIHRGEVMKQMRKTFKKDEPSFKYPELIEALKEQGIPFPMNEDFSRLQKTHSRWDPDGTVIEYFSPMLRTFLPVNMRGRYRGCWNTDDCVKGVDISKVPPKRDALEGFVERGRHKNIQDKYDDMSTVAIDEAHLDYLIEIQSFQAQTLPIPIFYDMLHLGMEVANENLRILVQEEGYPPTNPIFTSARDHAEQVRRKIQLYGALGLETLDSKRKGLGHYLPEWLMTRDEVIRQIMNRKDTDRYKQMEDMEKEAQEREKFRRETFEQDWNKSDQLKRKSKSRKSKEQRRKTNQ